MAKQTVKSKTEYERVAGDVLPVDSLPPGELPPELPGMIRDSIDSYCALYGVDDLRKMTAQEWTAVCLYVGQNVIKKYKVLHDIPRERQQGGIIYDGARVAALVDIWGALCSQYGKPPFLSDFCRFASVSKDYLKGFNGRQVLSSASSGVYEKIMEWQETGIASRLVDGKGSPVGQIFFLKNNHGWKDQREIVHATEKSGDAAATLPVFEDVPALPGENT